jgi:peptidoglycan L-alanyl-D-glutamate endopeptidase CwlK
VAHNNQKMTDTVSINRLNLLHPLIREDAIKAYQEAVQKTPVGVHPFIVQTLRTFEEQDALYQKGRTRPGPKVTNAKPGSSFHQYGLAIDFCLEVNGKLKWVVDKNWMIVVECFKKYGFEWGGDWKSFKDNPHVEKTFGFTWKELLALYNAKKIDCGYVQIKLTPSNLT